MEKNKLKGFCTIFAGICIHIIIGNVYTWANINTYLSSYLRVFDKSVTLQDGFFIVPTTILADTYVISISGFLSKFVGTRIMSSIGIITAILCYLSMYFFHNFWIILASFVFFGVGIGMSYYPILKTCWKYFPQQKGIITGVILCCFGFSPLIFTFLADRVINPKGVSTIEGYYPEDIALRLKNYALIMSIVTGTLGVLALCLMFPLDHLETGEEEDSKQSTDGPTPVSAQTDDEPLGVAAKSLEFHLINFMSMGTLFFGYFGTNTNRGFGSLFNINESDLQLMAMICSFLNGLFRIAWGFVYDSLGFKIPYTIVCLNQMIVSSTFYFSVRNKYSYLVSNILVNLSFSGHGTIIPPLITKIFGMKNAIILIGITGYFIGTIGFVTALIAKFVIKEKTDFLIVYLIGAGFATMGFIITCFVKERKFPYKKEHPLIEEIDKETLIRPSTEG